jgi:hypothetical protein
VPIGRPGGASRLGAEARGESPLEALAKDAWPPTTKTMTSKLVAPIGQLGGGTHLGAEAKGERPLRALVCGALGPDSIKSRGQNRLRH